MLRLTPVVKILLAINVILFLVSQSVPFIREQFALYPMWSDQFQIWQPLTHVFMHGGIGHLFFNMFGLVMFGSVLESIWGGRKFLVFYFFSALGAMLLHQAVDYWDFYQLSQSVLNFQETPSYGNFMKFFREVDFRMLQGGTELKDMLEGIATQLDTGQEVNMEQTVNFMEQYKEFARRGVPMVGASGAIYGLLAAYGILFPEAELMLIFLPVPIKAKYFIPLLMVGELIMESQQYTNIAHFAHLGGALFGALLLLYWRRFGTNL